MAGSCLAEPVHPLMCARSPLIAAAERLWQKGHLNRLQSGAAPYQPSQPSQSPL